MDIETTTAQAIRSADDKARYDAACKRLLSEKSILARIMRRCVPEYLNCSVEDIETRYIEGTPQVGEVPVFPDGQSPIIRGQDTSDKSVSEGTVTYDIRFQALIPGTDDRLSLIINIEAQNKYNPGYPLTMRGIYYCARMISSQYGQEFVESHYERLKKVYSIWICMDPPKEKANTITQYAIQKRDVFGRTVEPVEHYDLLTVIMLNIGDPEEPGTDKLLRMLGVLLSGKMKENEKRDILTNEYNIPMTREVEKEVTAMCNLSQGIEDRGIQIGVKRGIQKGRQETHIDLYWSMLNEHHWTSKEALDFLKIPADERESFLKEAQKANSAQ